MLQLWVESVLKVVVMAATVCSGVRVVEYQVLVGDEGHEEGRSTKQTPQDLDRAA
jgi:hypothetical protein